MTNKEMNDKILSEMTEIKNSLKNKSADVCQHHAGLVTDIKSMKEDIRDIKYCLLGNGKPGLKRDVYEHIANHKQVSGLTKYMIASVVLPVIAIVISIYAIKSTVRTDDKKIIQIVQKIMKQKK